MGVPYVPCECVCTSLCACGGQMTLTLPYSFGRQSFTEHRDTESATDSINPASVPVALGLHVCTWFYPTFYMYAEELNSGLNACTGNTLTH